MKKRSEKQQDLDNLKTELARVSTVILTTFQGITVENDTKLRRAVQAAGGKYQVVKNTLAERAGAGGPTEKLLKDLKGTNSIAYSANDPVALAKALTKIAKDVPSAGDAGSGEKKSEPAPEAVPAASTEASTEKGQ